MTVHKLTQHAAPSQLGLTKDEAQLRIFEAMVDAYKHQPPWPIRPTNRDRDVHDFLSDMTKMLDHSRKLLCLVIEP